LRPHFENPKIRRTFGRCRCTPKLLL